MAKLSPNAPTDRFEVKVTAESHFSWLRTRLSIERTMMSWVRTAIALIGFGFTIVQFFERMKEMPESSPSAIPDAPRYLGLSLIFCGVVALMISIWQYEWGLRYSVERRLRRDRGSEQRGGQQTPLLAVAIALALIGVFAFCAVASFRLAAREDKKCRLKGRSKDGNRRSVKWQNPTKPNILIIWGDDIGWFNISAYNLRHHGLPDARTSIASPKKARCSPTGMASRAAPPGARRSSPASRRSAPG